MTAAMRQTVKVYIADFEGCTGRVSFIMRLARAFKIDTSRIVKGEVWKALCERISTVCASGFPVSVRVVGLDDAYTSLPRECETLIRILRAAKDANECFRAEAVIGDLKWKI